MQAVKFRLNKKAVQTKYVLNGKAAQTKFGLNRKAVRSLTPQQKTLKRLCNDMLYII